LTTKMLASAIQLSTNPQTPPKPHQRPRQHPPRQQTHQPQPHPAATPQPGDPPPDTPKSRTRLFPHNPTGCPTTHHHQTPHKKGTQNSERAIGLDDRAALAHPTTRHAHSAP
jgi:hypothetical protein